MQTFIFYEGKLKQQMLNNANFLKAFLSILNGGSVLIDCNQIFPILMIQMLCSQIQQAPGPDFRKVGKSLELHRSS